jgi:hypothetical protein
MYIILYYITQNIILNVYYTNIYIQNSLPTTVRV